MVALHAISTILYTNSTSMYHYSLVSLGFYLLFLTKGRKVQDNQFGRISRRCLLKAPDHQPQDKIPDTCFKETINGAKTPFGDKL